MQAGISGYFQQTWLVLLLAAALSGSLALVDRSLQPRIEAHARNRLLAAILEVVPGGADSQLVRRGGESVYRVTDEQGALRGWAMEAQRMGFVDKIQLMIGLDAPAQRITGLVVLESKETPGLGEKIRDHEFRERFLDQPTDTALTVVKPGRSADHPIQAITGATISSRAVTDGVNERVATIRAALAAGEDAAEGIQ